MNAYISRVEVTGLFGRMDLAVDLRPGVNILYGRNGSGKTTLLHIIANMLSGSFNRFAFIQFDHARAVTGDGRVLDIASTPAESEGRVALRVSLNGDVAYEYQGMRRRPIPLAPRMADERIESDLTGAEPTAKPSDWLNTGGVVYFPAFRSTIEAWSDQLMRDQRLRQGPPRGSWHSRQLDMTERIRQMFGEFVPTISYPSPIEIEENLSSRIQYAQFSVARRGQDILSNAFVQAFSALSSSDSPADATSESILREIRDLLGQLDGSTLVDDQKTRYLDTYARLKDVVPSLSHCELSENATSILAVYRDSLSRMVEEQGRAYRPIRDYIDAVNGFLEDKRLVTSYSEQGPRRVAVAVEFADGSVARLGCLSSGERQIVSMMYAATYFGSQGHVVLIDEPEISLHLDWQRRLIPEMVQCLGDHQLIICTHSPEIGVDCECHYQPISAQSFAEPDTHRQGSNCRMDEGDCE